MEDMLYIYMAGATASSGDGDSCLQRSFTSQLGRGRTKHVMDGCRTKTNGGEVAVSHGEFEVRDSKGNGWCSEIPRKGEEQLASFSPAKTATRLQI